VSTGVEPSQGESESADSLFMAGEFSKANESYLEVLGQDPDNYQAITRLGQIALLANQLDEAYGWLTRAAELKPGDSNPRSLLAEVFCRSDAFQRATPLFRLIGREALANKLESFREALPYQIEGEAEEVNLKFAVTDPLPVVQVRVNDSELVNFIIDTGAAEVVLDREFAKEMAAAQFGSETGIFAGGKKAGFGHGAVNSLTLGDFTMRNVPVITMDVQRFSEPIFGKTKVKGIIGTVMLYHFLATIDYPGEQLFLRKKTEENSRRIAREDEEQKSFIVPFWMAGDHYMVAWGRVNNCQPMLFLVDTGLAGGGFTCPESTLKKAGIQLQENMAGEGIGGGGKVRVVPFIVDGLSLGAAMEHNVQGLYTENFPLEDTLGFHIGGIISHGFFRYYALTLDFSKMKYLLRRRE